MMKAIMTLCLFIGIATAHTQTTMEEYNYLTKGYKIQIESGLDMKKGYTLKYLFDAFTDYNIKFHGFYRNGETTPCAILAVLSRAANPNNTFYICVPHWKSDTEIWDKYKESLYPAIQKPLSIGLGQCAAYFAQNN